MADNAKAVMPDTPVLQTRFITEGVPTLHLTLGGAWLLDATDVEPDEILEPLRRRQVARVKVDGSAITAWDSALPTFLMQVVDSCRKRGVPVEMEGVPEGAQRVLQLAFAVPPRNEPDRDEEPEQILVRVGLFTMDIHRTWQRSLAFLGELSLALTNQMVGRAQYRRKDLWVLLEGCGAQALPIITLISLLVGMILAFVGAVQLRQFGAGLFVADLVGLGMAREMGAMMTAVIMAGRTGAAFAAQLGTMQVNDEIDALRTMGISPMEFLVLPRMFALIVMMPMLCVYSDFMGVLGGGLISAGMLEINLQAFFLRIQESVGLNHFLIGVGKSLVFGVVVALAGCLRGMQCGRSAESVGQATTSAVVSAIVLIVVCDAVMTLLCEAFGI